MKLNNIIILTRKQMGNFFSFAEFWAKRKEFRKTADAPGFLSPLDLKDDRYTTLRYYVNNWIGGKIDLKQQGVKLEYGNIILPNTPLLRKNTMGCEKELTKFKKEDAFGVVCLFEFLDRKIQQPDIFEICSTLGYEAEIRDCMFIKEDKEFEPITQPVEGDDADPLRSVVMVNTSKEHDCKVSIKDGESVILPTDKCMRALFWGGHCVKLLPYRLNGVEFIFDETTHHTGLSVDDSTDVYENVLAFAKCESQWHRIYSVESTGKKFFANHDKIDDDYIDDPFDKDEHIVYIELNDNDDEASCLLLTDKKNLYVRAQSDPFGFPFNDRGVIMASFKGNNAISVTYTNGETKIKTINI